MKKKKSEIVEFDDKAPEKQPRPDSPIPFALELQAHELISNGKLKLFTIVESKVEGSSFPEYFPVAVDIEDGAVVAWEPLGKANLISYAYGNIMTQLKDDRTNGKLPVVEWKKD